MLRGIKPSMIENGLETAQERDEVVSRGEARNAEVVEGLLDFIMAHR